MPASQQVSVLNSRSGSLPATPLLLPRLQFDWQSSGLLIGAGLLSGGKVVKAGPSCARGDWLGPLEPPPVRVAAHSATAAFASAGCVEVWSLEDRQVWKHVESLPTSLDLADGEQFVPYVFGTQISVGEGVMAVSAAVRRSGKSIVPAVAMFVSISRKEWVLAEVIKCETSSCLHTPQPCSAPGAFPSSEESPTGCLGGGFGSAVAVQGQILAIGIPNNNSVVLYKQQTTAGEFGAADAHGERARVGVGLVWKFQTILPGPTESSFKMPFGASLALSSSVIAVGYPSSEPTAGALIFSTLEIGTGAASFGELLLDVGQECCILQLPCCQSAYLGRAVDAMMQGNTARIVVGDPYHDGAVLVDCDVARMKDPANGHQNTRPICAVSSYVRAPTSATQEHGAAELEGRGLGASVALGGELVMFGNPSLSCAAAGGAAGGACGQMCHAASCAPGYCLLYDWSVDNHLCLSCSDENTCKGGLQVPHPPNPLLVSPAPLCRLLRLLKRLCSFPFCLLHHKAMPRLIACACLRVSVAGRCALWSKSACWPFYSLVLWA